MVRLKPVSTYLVVWFFTLVVICGFFIPRLSEKGSFIDGMVYSTISHNMAQGIGTFWKPVLKNSEFLFYKGDIFYDHPPLMFGIMSGFYKVFGDHADWIYTTVVLCLLLMSMWLLLQLFTPDINPGSFAFIPMVLFMTIPEVLQKISYPLLDFTMAFFTSIAVYFLCKALHDGRRFWLWSFAGGIFVVLAFLTKGPVGLFPLATPAIYYIVYRKFSTLRKTVFSTSIILGVLIIAFGIFYSHVPSRMFFSEYLDHQVLASIKGEREKTGTLLNHLSIGIKLLTQMIPMMVITLVFYLLAHKWNKGQKVCIEKPVYLFMGIGLAASLPIAISAKHHTFYLIPGLVFFTLMCSYYISRQIPGAWYSVRHKVNTLLVCCLMAALAAILVISFGRERKYYHTHASFLQQMEEMAPWLSETKCLGINKDVMLRRGDICCYMERYFLIELEVYPSTCTYYLMSKQDDHAPVKANLMVQTADFSLYQLP